MRPHLLGTAAALALSLPSAALGIALRRGLDRLTMPVHGRPADPSVGFAVDALGGEVVRLRSRDGLRLAGRWLPAEPASGDEWLPDPREAIVLLHGHGGSSAADLLEFGPFLRRTAGVLAFDFRGHGGSDAALTSMGLHEVEDVAGALSWLAERGVSRVALFGTSMGALTALAALAVLGDGSLVAADIDPDAPRDDRAPAPPRLVGIVADSATPQLAAAIASEVRGALARPFARPLVGLLLIAATRRLGGDPRAIEPGRIAPLLDSVPILLVHGEADRTMPVEATRRLAETIGPSAELWTVPEAGHGRAHRVEPAGYEARLTGFLRRVLAAARDSGPIIATGTPDVS
ncbi:MAG TPA: alpha/beta hydrolase [Candidatus Limnocylindrales bacterium]